MKNKFTITEEEKCRILNLHESAILKENSQNILNEEKTYTFKSKELFFKQKDGGLNARLKLFKGTTFEVWPKDEMVGENFVENYLITTKKVTAQFAEQINNVVMFAKNKSWVGYNCKTKSFYLMNSTDKVVAASKDFASNERMVFPSDGKTPPLDELCKTTIATRIKTVDKKITDLPPEEEKITSGTKEDKLDKDIDCKNKNPYNALTDGGLNWKKESQKWISDKCNGTTPCILGNAKTNINLRNAFCNKTWPTDQNNLQKLDKYTFNFDEIMKAIDVTGKCPKKSDKVDSDKVESDKNVTDDEFNKYIDGAAPVDKKLSDEDYYKLIN